MATVWLDPGEVSERLGVCRKTAIRIMNEMPHSVIGGTVKTRVRVSEQNLENWMASREEGQSRAVSGRSGAKGAGKRIPRWGE